MKTKIACMNGRLSFGFAALVACSFVLVQTSSQVPGQSPKEPVAPSYSKDVLPFLQKHCFSCHGNGKKKGGMSFDKYKGNEDVLKDRATWELVQQVVESKQMPPKDRPQPAVADIKAIL